MAKVKDRTTIQLKKAILKELKSCKKYERETYNEVLKRLIRKEKKIK